MDTKDLRIIDRFTLWSLLEDAKYLNANCPDPKLKESYELHFIGVANNALRKTADFAKYYDEKGTIKTIPA